VPLTRAEQLIDLLLARQQPRAVLEKSTRLPYGWALWLRSLGPLPRPFHAREVIAVFLPRPLPGPPGQSPRLSPWQALRRLFWQDWDAAPHVGRLSAGVVGGVAHRGHAGHAGHQGLLDALLEGHVGHAAALATATEAQQHHAFARNFLHGHLAAMRGQLRIDFVFHHPVHALDQRSGIAGRFALDARRLDGQLLGTGTAGDDVDLGAIEPTDAAGINVKRETIAVHRPLVAEQVGRFGELQPGVGARRTGVDRAQAHAHAGHALAFDQLAEMGLGSVGDLDHQAILAK